MIFPSNASNIVGKTKIDRLLMTTDDWHRAKEFADSKAADRIIDNLWPPKKTKKLLALFNNDLSKSVFISTPSTSGMNILPIKFARRLAGDCGTKALTGDQYFNAVHQQQSKHIPRLRRPFERRKYVCADSNALIREVKDCGLIVVEDVLTTGGSVAVFCKSLYNENLAVKSVVGLMGERRIAIDPKTKEHLKISMDKTGLSFNIDDIAVRLTRAEAGDLIMQINSARSKNAKEKITKNLQRLFNQKPLDGLERDQTTGGHEGLRRSNNSDERIHERISYWHLLQNRKITRNKQELKGDKITDERYKQLKEKYREEARRQLDKEYGDDMEQSHDRGGFSRER